MRPKSNALLGVNIWTE